MKTEWGNLFEKYPRGVKMLSVKKSDGDMANSQAGG